MTSPEFERAARAACIADGHDPDMADTPWSRSTDLAVHDVLIPAWRNYTRITEAVLRSALMEPEVVEAVRDALDKEDQRKACTFDDYARAALRAAAMKMLGKPTATPELT